MIKNILGCFFHRKNAVRNEEIKVYPAPTQDEVDTIDVETASYAVKAPVPFLPQEKDIWVICGKGIGLRGETIGKISSGLRRKGYELQYYDKVLGGITKETIEYNFPDLDIDVNLLSLENFIKAIREGLGLDIPERSILFIHYDGKTEPDLFGDEPVDSYRVFDASAPNAHEFLTKALAYIQFLEVTKSSEIRFSKRRDDSDVRFSVVGHEDDEYILFREGNRPKIDDEYPPTPDEVFDKEMEKVERDTRLGLKRLILNGYSIDVIESWINEYSRRSRVVITDKFKILLPDYQNKEVVMNQLPKALYLFFLKHDRGYAIYQMQDQKRELMNIYQKLTNSNDLETIEKRIDSLVNPDGISFVEKCSMIRKAFDGKVPNRFVQDYFIQGPQGEAKCIKLDRSLVTWLVNI